jgi:hypothetical protein
MVRKGRHADKSGEKSNFAKLTEADVKAIRSDPRPHSIVAKDYGIHQPAVSRIKNRTRWTHI